MFRGEAPAFASDQKARGLAHFAIQRNFDARTDFPARQFFYLPFMHSETMAHQDRAVRLFAMKEYGGRNLSTLGRIGGLFASSVGSLIAMQRCGG